MSLLSRLFGQSQKPQRETPEVRVVTPRQEARRNEARRHPRVALDSATQLYRRGTEPVPCTVADASADGLRLVLDEPVAPDTTVGVVLHFNGCFLRLRARVVWAMERAGRFEVGAAALPPLVDDGGLKESFARYISWKAAVAAA